MRRLAVLLLAFAVAGCATYREDLNRGQRLYEESEYEKALAIWRYLEADVDSLGDADRARYAYLRGMTDYRLGGGRGGKDRRFRAHARYWLAIAKAIDQEHGGGLSERWRQLMEEALSDLNAEVWGIDEVRDRTSTPLEVRPLPVGSSDAGAVKSEPPRP